MKVIKDEIIELGNYDIVTVKRMKNVLEIRKSDSVNSDMPFTKISDTEYMLKQTGEVREFNKSDDRSQNNESLRQTFKRLRDLINSNFEGAKNELFITLTYKDNMTDTKKLYSDFVKFNKKMIYKYKDIDYINVVEPQGRGAWHCHVLYRFNDCGSVYIKNSDIAEMWGHGFVTVRQLENCDNIGAYLSAYLADIEFTDDNYEQWNNYVGQKIDVVEKEIGGQKKKFIKGGRMHLYPSGMNLYRSSKGIVKPDVSVMQFSEVKKIVGFAEPHYLKNIVITDDNNKKLNRHQYLQYNLRRL